MGMTYGSLFMGLTSLVPRPPHPMRKGGLAKCCKILGPDMSHSEIPEYQSDFLQAYVSHEPHFK